MLDIRWLRALRVAAICTVAALGVVGFELDRLNADGGGLASSWLSDQDSAMRAWDRAGNFKRTYRKAQVLCPDPYSADDFIALGRDRLLNQEDATKAMSDLRRVLTITPEEDAGWSDLAWLYAVSGDNQSAISAELKAISLYRYDYTYFVLLGLFYEQSGRTNDAQAAYGEALVLFPRLIQSYFWHALQRRRPPLAAGAFQLAMTPFDQRTFSSSDLLRSESFARLLLAHNDIKSAQSIIDSINSQIQNLSGIWELQGEVHEREKQMNEAAVDFERASFLDRTDPLPHERLASLALKLQMTDMAADQAYQAWWSALRLRSPSSARYTLEFQRVDGPRDGLLPDTLFRQTQPAFNFASTFSRLSALYAMHGAEERARELTTMAKRSGPADESESYGSDDN